MVTKNYDKNIIGMLLWIQCAYKKHTWRYQEYGKKFLSIEVIINASLPLKR